MALLLWEIYWDYKLNACEYDIVRTFMPTRTSECYCNLSGGGFTRFEPDLRPTFVRYHEFLSKKLILITNAYPQPTFWQSSNHRPTFYRPVFYVTDRSFWDWFSSASRPQNYISQELFSFRRVFGIPLENKLFPMLANIPIDKCNIRECILPLSVYYTEFKF